MASPSSEDIPTCSRPHAPIGQQTPAVRSHRTAHWGFSEWHCETWVKGKEKEEQSSKTKKQKQRNVLLVINTAALNKHLQQAKPCAAGRDTHL